MTCISQIKNNGARLRLLIQQGTTFGPLRFRLKNPDGSLVNFTGWDMVAKLRRDPQSATGEVDIPIDWIDRANGRFDIGMTDEETAAIPCGKNIEATASQYAFAVVGTDTLGRKIQFLYGLPGDVRIQASSVLP